MKKALHKPLIFCIFFIFGFFGIGMAVSACAVFSQPKVVCALGNLAAVCLEEVAKDIKK